MVLNIPCGGNRKQSRIEKRSFSTVKSGHDVSALNYSTVTDFARLRGLSISSPLSDAT